jgi:hypothetical protein
MRDLLVRYLLGELDERERALVETQLGDSAELRRELAYLRECLPAAREPGGEPPTGLAERTVERISGYPTTGDGCSIASVQRPASSEAAPVVSTPYWSFVDLTVAGGVLLAMSMLFLPAMRQSRDASRRNVCADNQRQIHGMLTLYSDQHGNYFPLVGQNDNAGIFAVQLVNKGFVTADELGQLLVCPSSPLADEVAAGCVVIAIPTMVQLRAAAGEELAELRRVMGGSYAYRIGYVKGPQYLNVPNHRCPHTPLMADEPSYQLANLKSANHGGCGQNVLYQDGSVRYLKSCQLAEREDHLYLNDRGEPAAGCAQADTVLGASEATPGVVALETVR